MMRYVEQTIDHPTFPSIFSSHVIHLLVDPPNVSILLEHGDPHGPEEAT